MALCIVRRLSQIVSVPGFHWTRQVNSGRVAFEGMTQEESKPMIDWLQAHATRPEFTCRVHWKPGTLTIWDNRRAMHNAINDYHGMRRHMRRLTSGPTNPV